VSPVFNRRLARIAVVGALAAALGVAGCGRKSGLDPPPEASIAEPGAPPPTGSAAGVGPDGRALAPAQGPKRSTPLDWLLN
jgi:predicted small lipoprotein YifL